MLKVYYDLMSQPSRAVVLFLKINKIPYESCSVALRKGEHFTESFAKINPFQKVPVIDDCGFTLPESVAILRYLARTKNVADHWYPQDPKRQAVVDEYLEWQHLNIRFNCAMYFQVKFLQPSITGIAPKPERVSGYLKRMETSLDQVEKLWLKNGGKKYLTGDEISIADILGACEIEQPKNDARASNLVGSLNIIITSNLPVKMAGYDVRQSRPYLSAWMDRVRSDLSPYYDEAHDVVNKVAKRFGGNPPLQSKM